MPVGGRAAHSAASRFAPWVKRAWGLVPALGHAGAGSDPSPTPVVFHGGTVMRNVEVHTVFWAPAGYAFPGAPTPGALTDEGLLQRFFGDAAQASGSAASALAVTGQYGDGGGPGSSALRYAVGTDSIDDTDRYPAAGQCTSPLGLPVCLTAGQAEAELDQVIARHDPGGRGLHDLWLLLLPPDVDECIDVGICGTSTFAGYHSEFDRGHGPTIYAVIVNPLIEGVPGPGFDPEGNPVAEVTADVAGHEAVEAVSDPEGTGWIDPSGAEVGDRCQATYGAILGYAPDGSPYNQLLNGDPFLIQTMWSNAASACASRGQAASAPSLPHLALRQFSPVIRGSVPATRPGTAVEVGLVRAGDPIAGGQTTVRRGGAWALTLRSLRTGSPVAVGDDRDELDVRYGRGGPPAETILTGQGGNPQGQAGFTGWTLLDSGTNVGAHSVSITPCSQVGVLTLTVGGRSTPPPVQRCSTTTDTSTLPTGPIGPATVVSLTSTDNRAASESSPLGALVRLTVTLGEAGAAPTSLRQVANTNLPACVADLGRQSATCNALVAGHRYRVRTGRLTLTARADRRGHARFAAPGHAAWLTGGHVLSLLGPTGRVLSSLRIARLRVALDAAGNVVGGTCQPGEYWGLPAPSEPSSGVSDIFPPFLLIGVSTSGPQAVCPLTGHAAGLPAGALQQSDSFSAGATMTEVFRPALVSPANAATLYGPFIAVAQVTPATAGTPAPTVSLRITRAGARRPVVSLANVATTRGTRVRALRPGLYHATWTLTDRNGDTRSLRTYFVQEP